MHGTKPKPKLSWLWLFIPTYLLFNFLVLSWAVTLLLNSFGARRTKPRCVCMCVSVFVKVQTLQGWPHLATPCMPTGQDNNRVVCKAISPCPIRFLKTKSKHLFHQLLRIVQLPVTSNTLIILTTDILTTKSDINSSHFSIFSSFFFCKLYVNKNVHVLFFANNHEITTDT